MSSIGWYVAEHMTDLDVDKFMVEFGYDAFSLYQRNIIEFYGPPKDSEDYVPDDGKKYDVRYYIGFLIDMCVHLVDKCYDE